MLSSYLHLWLYRRDGYQLHDIYMSQCLNKPFAASWFSDCQRSLRAFSEAIETFFLLEILNAVGEDSNLLETFVILKSWRYQSALYR